MQFTAQNTKIIIKVPVSTAAITADHIRQALAATDYAKCFLLQAQLDNLLAEYQQLRVKVQDKTLEENAKVLTYPIAEIRPAEVRFEVSEDKMAAFAFITAAYGGAPLAANALVKAAQDAGIVFGFQKDNIIRLVQEALKAPPGLQIKAEIASGRVVKQGVNSRFEPLIDDMVSRRKKPVAASVSKADLRDFGAIPSVTAGQPIMQRFPPTPGEPGFTVTGEKIAPEPGTQVDWQLGSGVKLSDSDPNVLIAERDGMPRAIDNGATVDDVFNIKNVDLTSGHIIFKGSVVISGSVIAGMKVIAEGNVFVQGVVEGQLIEAGGDINVTGAIIGHQLANSSEFSTVLKAKGDIHCSMAQYSELHCQGDLFATKYLMHCAVEAQSVLVGTADKITGKVVGGTYQLAKSLSCGQLGSPSSGVVVVKLNRLLQPIMDQQALLREQIVQLRRELAELKEQIEQQKKLSKGSHDPQLQMFEQELPNLVSLIKALITEVKTLEEQRLAIYHGLEITVTQQIFSAVELQFGKDQMRTRREYGPSRVKVIENRLGIEPL